MSNEAITDAPAMDVVIGQRIKACRRARKMSQTKLAEKVDLAWQQIQKYEGGKNRVSASMLWKIADVFEVPVSHFFEAIAQDFDAKPVLQTKTSKPRADTVAKMFDDLGAQEKNAVFSFLKSVSEKETKVVAK